MFKVIKIRLYNMNGRKGDSIGNNLSDIDKKRACRVPSVIMAHTILFDKFNEPTCYFVEQAKRKSKLNRLHIIMNKE